MESSIDQIHETDTRACVSGGPLFITAWNQQLGCIRLIILQKAASGDGLLPFVNGNMHKCLKQSTSFSICK